MAKSKDNDNTVAQDAVDQEVVAEKEDGSPEKYDPFNPPKGGGTVTEEPPPLKEVASGVVVETRGGGVTHLVLRNPTGTAQEQVIEIAPHQDVALNSFVRIYEDGSVVPVRDPPPKPVEISLPTEVPPNAG